VLCGCSKRSKKHRGSMYVVSAPAAAELTDSGPPSKSASGHVTPAAPPTASVRRHVERYVAGGGRACAVTVSVRQRRHGDDDVGLQRSSYDNCEPVLDKYLRAAMATHDADSRSSRAKVQHD